MSRTKKDKTLCAGCRDNFYNGNNTIGVSECWSFKSARVVKKRRVGMNERPPWLRKPEMVLSCCRPKGAIMVRPDQEC